MIMMTILRSNNLRRGPLDLPPRGPLKRLICADLSLEGLAFEDSLTSAQLCA